MKRRLPLTVVFLFFSLTSAHAATYYINPAGTGDFPTLQAAIDGVSAYDTIVCAAGTYSWSNQGTGTAYGMLLISNPPPMTIIASSGPETTILDGQNLGRILFYQGGPNPVSIEGFTFTRGKASIQGDFNGGGFAGHLSSPTLRNCVFYANSANAGGAFWFGGQGEPKLLDCEFYDNSAANGGALFLINSAPTARIERCAFHNNVATSGGGAIYAANYSVTIFESVFYDNIAGTYGGAMRVTNSNPTLVRRCTFFGNEAPTASGFSIVGSNSLTLHRVIISKGSMGSAVQLDAFTTLDISCTDIWGHINGDWVNGIESDLGINDNFSANPLFCSPGGGNFYLAANSPCTTGALPNCARIGAYNVACGAVPTEATTWGAIKARYSAPSPDR